MAGNRMCIFKDVTVLRTTDKAMLCDIEGQEVWIPVSQIDEDGTDISEEGDEGTLVIPEWLSIEKGLI